MIILAINFCAVFVLPPNSVMFQSLLILSPCLKCLGRRNTCCVRLDANIKLNTIESSFESFILNELHLFAAILVGLLCTQ